MKYLLLLVMIIVLGCRHTDSDLTYRYILSDSSVMFTRLPAIFDTIYLMPTELPMGEYKRKVKRILQLGGDQVKFTDSIYYERNESELQLMPSIDTFSTLSYVPEASENWKLYIANEDSCEKYAQLYLCGNKDKKLQESYFKRSKKFAYLADYYFQKEYPGYKPAKQQYQCE